MPLFVSPPFLASLLMRMRVCACLVQERDSARLMSSQRGSRENRAHLANHRSQRDKDHGEGRLLRELDRLGARTQRLRATLEGTEKQMQIAGRGGTQVEQLKGRVVTLLGRQMREKTVKFQIQRSIEGVEKKVRIHTGDRARLVESLDMHGERGRDVTQERWGCLT